MPDFFQNGLITTFHSLRPDNDQQLEKALASRRKSKPVALVLPALLSDFESEAMDGILNALSGTKAFRRVVVVLGGADEGSYRRAREDLSRRGLSVDLLWLDSPRMQEIVSAMEREFWPFNRGKGLAIWLATGYVLMKGDCRVLCYHDCDIVNYSVYMPIRLSFPVADLSMGYSFAKGYYCRFSDRLYGRVTRLFMLPLIRALFRMLGRTDYLVYLDSFRYILSGEFAISDDLAWRINFPSDWGLEVGILSEVYRSSTLDSICQVEIADRYEHKHREFTPGDMSKGINKMAVDIARTLFRQLASDGVVFSDGFFNTLMLCYLREGHMSVKKYQDESVFNGLAFDRHLEALEVENFCHCLAHASREVSADLMSSQPLPRWIRVLSAMPELAGELVQMVDGD